MGLALDEPDDDKDTSIVDNGVDIVYDKKVGSYISTLPDVIIDFVDSERGGGFFLDTGISCGGC